MNKTILVGNLTKSPELKFTSNGTAVASFTVACQRPFKNQQGEYEADFINCTAWKKTAEIVAEHFDKGSKIGVEGRINTRNYENSEGKRVFVTEVIVEQIEFVTPKQNKQKQTKQQQPKQDDPFNDSPDIQSEELPF